MMDITKVKFRIYAGLLLVVLGVGNAGANIEQSEPVIEQTVPREILQLQQQIERELGVMESLPILNISERLNQKGLSPQQLHQMKSQLEPDMQRIKRSAARIQRWSLLVNARWKLYEHSQAYQDAIEANKAVSYLLDNTLAIYLKIGDLTEGLLEIYDAKTGITDTQFERVSRAVGIFELEQRLSL